MTTFGKRMMMTLVGGLGLLFVAACGTTLTGPVVAATVGTAQLQRAQIGVNSPGDIVVTGAYCVGVDIPFMRTFTAMLEKEGTKGYWEFLRQKDVPCYDTRLGQPNGLPINPVKATLLERLWVFKLSSGKEYVMWKAEDEYGHIAYTWMPHEGQGV